MLKLNVPEFWIGLTKKIENWTWIENRGFLQQFFNIIVCVLQYLVLHYVLHKAIPYKYLQMAPSIA